MFASLTRFPGDLFPEMEALQRQVEQWLGAGSWPSSIRAAGRGAFPALNMGMTGDAVEIYAFAPGLDPSKIDVQLEKGLLIIAFGMVFSLKRSLKAGAGGDLDSGSRLPAKSAPR